MPEMEIDVGRAENQDERANEKLKKKIVCQWIQLQISLVNQILIYSSSRFPSVSYGTSKLKLEAAKINQ